jgi:uncharacterized heparinase superfamily protein
LGNSRERFGEIEEPLVNAPKEVPIEMGQAPDGLRLQAGHDGFVAGYGITHARTLELTFDGRGLVGEDLLVTLEDTAKRQFDKRMDANSLQGIPFDVRFHIHPDADVALDMGGTAVSIALKSGEIWVFRHDSPAEMTVEPSVYLEKTRLKPRATKQVVLSGVAIEYATRIRWSLAKAQDSAVAIRDLNRDEPDMTN